MIELKQNYSCAEQLYNEDKRVEFNRHELLTLIQGGGMGCWYVLDR